ncbi:Uncharacterised protein [Bordetella pertussis]|nr:Uncharacterised protein [Bordetella pertussis]
MRQGGGKIVDRHRHHARHHIGERRVAALVGHVRDGRIRHALEQFGRQVRRGAGARAGVERLGRVGLEIGQQFADAFGRHRRIDHQHVHHGGDLGDRREVLDVVVARVLVQARIDGVRVDRAHVERVAVGRRVGARLGADIAAGAGPVLDHHGLAPHLAEIVGNQAREEIRAAARRERHDHRHGLGGIRGPARHGRAGQHARGGAHGPGRQQAGLNGLHWKFPYRCVVWLRLASISPRSRHYGSRAGKYICDFWLENGQTGN